MEIRRGSADFNQPSRIQIRSDAADGAGGLGYQRHGEMAGRRGQKPPQSRSVFRGGRSTLRYSRGYFAISDTSDVPALLHVRNARAIQFEQLWEFLSHDGVKTTAASLRWRVARLEKAGLITRSNEYRHLGKPVFTITHVGLDLLESRGHYLVALPSNVEQILHPSQISHALELVRIRLALLRAGLLVSWKGELEVASRNLILETEVSKDYDAIAEIALAGGSVRVAIEYERSAKAAARYRAIRDSLEKDDSV